MQHINSWKIANTFFLFNLIFVFFVLYRTRKTHLSKDVTQNTKAKTKNIKLKSQNTEVTSYKHKTKIILSQTPICDCALCKDVLSHEVCIHTGTSLPWFSYFTLCFRRYINDMCPPASILRKSTSGRHRPVSYPDGPMTARYRFT